jgi:hypothetical protein
LTNVIAIAAGSAHALALKSDGTVAGWGWNNFGQATVPPGLSNVIAVAAGWHDSLVLRSDGTVFGWGDKDFGETNVPAALSNVVAISLAQNYCMALTVDLKTIFIEPGGQGPRIRFHTFPGQLYTVEYSPDMHDGAWVPLPNGNAQGTGEDVSVTDSNAAEGAARFYRVKRSVY